MIRVIIIPEQIDIIVVKGRNYSPLGVLLENSQADLFQIFSRVVNGVATLHNNQIVHRSLNLTSIFSNRKNLVRIGFPLFGVIEKQQRKLSTFRNQNKQNIYFSPEVQQNQGFSFSSDIWALGIILLQIVLKKIVEKCKVSQLRCMMEKVLPGYLKQLIKKMLSQESKQRPTISQIKIVLQQRKMPAEIIKNNFLTKIWTVSLCQCNKEQLRTVKTQKNSKVFLYKTVRFNLKPCTLTIQFSSAELISLHFENQQSWQRYLIIIRDQFIPQTLSKYFLNVDQIYDYLHDHRKQVTNYNVIFTDTGEVQFYLSAVQSKKLKQKVKNSIVKKEHPHNCIGIVNSFGKQFPGFLVGLDIVITSADALFNRQTKTRAQKIQFSLYPDFISKSSCFCCQAQFQTSSDSQKSKFNYGVIILQKKVSRINTLTLLYDYDEAMIAKKLKQLKNDMSFDYYIGKNKLSASQFNQFLYQEDHLQKLLPVGSPILVKFSNGRVGVIGMVTGKSFNNLFTENFRNNLLTWLIDLKYFKRENIDKNIVQLSLRSFNVKQFNFSSQQIPLINGQIKPYQINPNQSQVSDDKQNIAAAAYWESLGISSLRAEKDPMFKEIINKLKKFVNLYKRLLGEDNWKASYMYYLIASIYKRKLYNEAAKLYYNKAVELQQKYQYNPLILCNCYLKIASLQKQQSSMTFYKKAIQSGLKYKDYLTAGDAYHGLGNLLADMGRYEESINFFQKGIQIKLKYRSTGDYLRILISYIKQCFKMNLFVQSLQYFKQMLRVKKDKNYVDTEISKFIKNFQEDCNEMIKTRKTVGKKVQQLMQQIAIATNSVSLKLQYLANKMQN